MQILWRAARSRSRWEWKEALSTAIDIIIDKQGVLSHAIYGVTPCQHAEDTLNRIKEMDEACR